MIELTITGELELREHMQQASAALPGDVYQVIETGLLLLEADMRTHVPRAFGQLGNSITHHVSGSGADLVGEVGSTAKYWPFVEYGTRPHWPPIAAITPWANLHGIPPFLVARAIARRGTRAQPFIMPAWERQKAAIEALFNRIGAKVIARMRGDSV